MLCQKCHIGPQQTCSIKMKISSNKSIESIGNIKSNEDMLAAHQCDILDGFWTGDSECIVPMTNLGTRLVQLRNGSNNEDVDLITLCNSVWDENLCPTVVTITPTE